MQTKQLKNAVLAIILLCAGISNANALVYPQKSRPTDSIMNLLYNPVTYPGTLKALEKMDKSMALSLDSAVTFINNLPACWAMSPVYKYRMQRLMHRQLLGYAGLVKQEYRVFEKIEADFKPEVNPMQYEVDKPVIYLYPDKHTPININLGFTGTELYTWPKINAGMNWFVTAQPNGMLKDAAGDEYPYLFWEGKMDIFANTDMSTGFVVKADETEEFFRDKLKILGLNAREYTDFITFWGPRMRKNKYNLIHFETTVYNNKVPLNVTPKPESSQRILMVYQGLDKPVEVTPQELQPFTRKGYTLIEWGGMEMPAIIN